ncbi:unnamed protein product [Merluccius merluccius]
MSSSSSSSPQEQLNMAELNLDLDRMIEDIENISVQLTWMTYSMVVERTSPERGDAARRLQDAYQRCRAAVCRGEDDASGSNPEPGEDQCPGSG